MSGPTTSQQLWQRTIAALVMAPPIAVSDIVMGSFAGVMFAEVVRWLGIAGYDRSVPDAEVDLWFMSAAPGAMIGLVISLALALRIVMTSKAIEAQS